jgi:HSP20 family protein
MAREKALARRERTELEQLEPWNTFRDMERMFRDFFMSPLPMLRRSWLIPELRHELEPEVDLRETEKEFILSAAIPGLSKDDIEINVTDDRITVSGERKVEEEKPQERVHIRQQTYGTFRVCYTLPADVKPDEVKATYKSGVLEVHMPKAEVTEPHKVNVEVEE